MDRRIAVLADSKFRIYFPFGFNKRSHNTAPFVAYQISSGMRNPAYQPMCPEPGNLPAHPSAFPGRIRIAGADTPVDFPVCKTADQVPAAGYCLE